MSMQPELKFHEVGSCQRRGLMIGVNIPTSPTNTMRVIVASDNLIDRPWVLLKSMSNILSSELSAAFDTKVASAISHLILKYRKLSELQLGTTTRSSLSNYYEVICVNAFALECSILHISLFECSIPDIYLFELEEVNSTAGTIVVPYYRKCQVRLSNKIINCIILSASVEEVTGVFCDTALEVLTDCNRVWTLKFLRDGSAEIISEKIMGSVKSLVPCRLNDLLPVDIFNKPECYMKSKWRYVYDVEEGNSKIYCCGSAPLDINRSKFVAPTEQCRNFLLGMGVRTALGIVIVVNGCVWGMYLLQSIGRLMVPTHEQCVLLDSIASTSILRLTTILRDDHFALMARQVQSPLQGIACAFQILHPIKFTGSTNCDADYLKIVDAALISSDLMLTTINVTLNSAAQCITEPAIPNSLSKLLRNVNTILKPLATCKSVSLQLLEENINSLPEKVVRELEESNVVGEDIRIVQIVENLVVNAIKVTPPRGSVVLCCSCLPIYGIKSRWNSVTIRYTSSYIAVDCDCVVSLTDIDPSMYWVVLEVEDTGCGVSEINMNSIFRSDGQSNGSGENYYITNGEVSGLHIVKQHVNSMGGMLGIASEFGRGTLIFCAFPLLGHNISSHQYSINNFDDLQFNSTEDQLEANDVLNQVHRPLSDIQVINIDTSSNARRVIEKSVVATSKSQSEHATPKTSGPKRIVEVGVIQNHWYIIGVKNDNGRFVVAAINQEILSCPWVRYNSIEEVLGSDITCAFNSSISLGLTSLIYKYQLLSESLEFQNDNSAEAKNTAETSTSALMSNDIALVVGNRQLSLSIVECSTPDIYLFDIEYIDQEYLQTKSPITVIKPTAVADTGKFHVIKNISTVGLEEIPPGFSPNSKFNLKSQFQSPQHEPGRTNDSTNCDKLNLKHTAGALCDTALELVPDCDRALIFKFRSDGSVETCNESIREPVALLTPTLLGKIFPATTFADKEVYLRYSSRVVYDIEDPYRKVFGYNIENLDLSKGKSSVLSAHGLAAFRRSGVRSGLSVSIIVNGRLWGICSLHSLQHPMVPTYEQRVLLEAITGNLASRLESLSREEFISHMSHELRTPLHGITSALQILQCINTQSRHFSSIVESGFECSEQMRITLQDILMINSISRRRVIATRQFELSKLIFSVVQNFQSLAAKNSVSIFLKRSPTTSDFRTNNRNLLWKDYELSGKVRTTVLGDENRISKILNNLLSNATKFTSSGGSITLNVYRASESCLRAHWNVSTARYVSSFVATGSLNSCQARDNQKNITFLKSSRFWLVIEVSDTGCGVPDVDMERIFDAYQQLSSGVSKTYQGIGLGLHVARLHVSIMSGILGVASTVGVGSLFFCAIPIQTPSQSNPNVGIEGRTERNDTGLSCKRSISSTELVDNNVIFTVPHRLLSDDELLNEAQDLYPLEWPRKKTHIDDNISVDYGKLKNAHETVRNVCGHTSLIRDNPMSVIFLAVDDSKVNLRMLQRKIAIAFENDTNVAVECLAALDGSAAVEVYKSIVKDGKINLLAGIFMDYHMPVCNGVQAIAQIRIIEGSMSLRPVHIIGFTADYVENSIRAMLDSGANEIMPKPTPPNYVERLCQCLVKGIH